MLHLKPTPDDWRHWKSSLSISNHAIEIRLLNVKRESKPHSGNSPLSQGWLISASLTLAGLPELDEKRRIVIPIELRESCEVAINHIANLISVLEGCSRTVLSPTPCLGLEYESDEEQCYLGSSTGIKAKGGQFEFGLRPPISRTDASLISALSDRTNGVALLAESYSGGGASSRFRDFVRLFELAFRLPSSQLSKKLANFLPAAMGYTRQEVHSWLTLRDPHSHADFRKSSFIAVASDVAGFLRRMEQACLDVLFNKAEWMSPTNTRRNIWFPDAFSTSSTGESICRQGTKGKAIIRILDEYGAFPCDLEAALSSFAENNMYVKIADA